MVPKYMYLSSTKHFLVILNRTLAGDNSSLQSGVVHLEQQLESAFCEIEDRIQECKNLKETLKLYENRLNTSIKESSPVKANDSEFIKKQVLL